MKCWSSMSDARQNKITRTLAIALTIVGCLQFGGYILKSRALRGLGFSFGVSPHPIVFGTVNGVEGFNTYHTLIYVTTEGNQATMPLDQKSFSQFNGSFFLKMAYSLFLAYPHMLKPEQVEQGSEYFFCKQGLQENFNVNNSKSCLAIESERQRYGRSFNSTLTSRCTNE